MSTTAVTDKGVRRSPRATGQVGAYVILALFLVITLFPFLWMLRTAITPRTAAFSLHPRLLPTTVTGSNFQRVISSPTIPFLQQFKNSMIVSFGTTALVILAGTWGAYALARLNFKGKRAFGFSVLLIQLFPGVLLIIPLFIVMVNIHLANSLLGLIITYTTINLPFVVWLLRGYFLSIPYELEDAGQSHLNFGRFSPTFLRNSIPFPIVSSANPPLPALQNGNFGC